MTEHSRLWDGTSTGDATDAPYDFGTELAEIFSALTGAEGLTGHGGVFRDALNKLACSTAGTVQVTIATGLALSYGGWYYNDAPLNIVIATPGSSTRVDRIVLRKNWTTQTIRLTKIVGVEGAGAPALGAGAPAYTQTAGATWDLPLFQVTITTGGAITITSDDRVLLPVHGDQSAESGTKHSAAQVTGLPASADEAPLSVGFDKVAATGSDTGHYANDNHVHAVDVTPLAVSTGATRYGTSGADAELVLPAVVGHRYIVHVRASLAPATAAITSTTVGFTGSGVILLGYGGDPLNTSPGVFPMTPSGLTATISFVGTDPTIIDMWAVITATSTTIAFTWAGISSIIGITMAAGSFIHMLPG